MLNPASISELQKHFSVVLPFLEPFCCKEKSFHFSCIGHRAWLHFITLETIRPGSRLAHIDKVNIRLYVFVCIQNAEAVRKTSPFTCSASTFK